MAGHTVVPGKHTGGHMGYSSECHRFFCQVHTTEGHVSRSREVMTVTASQHTSQSVISGRDCLSVVGLVQPQYLPNSDYSPVSMTLTNPDFLKRIFSPESVKVHFRVERWD